MSTVASGSRRVVLALGVAVVAVALVDIGVVAARAGGSDAPPCHPAANTRLVRVAPVTLRSTFPLPAITMTAGQTVRFALPAGVSGMTAPISGAPSVLCAVALPDAATTGNGTAVTTVTFLALHAGTSFVRATTLQAASNHPALGATVTVR
jgi:hypothetical protein